MEQNPAGVIIGSILALLTFFLVWCNLWVSFQTARLTFEKVKNNEGLKLTPFLILFLHATVVSFLLFSSAYSGGSYRGSFLIPYRDHWQLFQPLKQQGILIGLPAFVATLGVESILILTPIIVPLGLLIDVIYWAQRTVRHGIRGSEQIIKAVAAFVLLLAVGIELYAALVLP